MSVTMNWNKGKLMIRNNLLHYYDTLKNKDLTTSELKYIIRTVVASQVLYYLNVTPLTDTELTTLDNKMAQLWKHSIGTIPGASSPLCFSTFGLSFPNLVEARRSLLIRQAHSILNSTGLVRNLAMSRLRGLSTEWGYFTCPLNMPVHTNVGFQHHWFTRVHSALRAYNCTMPDIIQQVVLRSTPRTRDKALAPLLPHNNLPPWPPRDYTVGGRSGCHRDQTRSSYHTTFRDKRKANVISRPRPHPPVITHHRPTPAWPTHASLRGMSPQNR
jgi:hypothetical protein